MKKKIKGPESWEDQKKHMRKLNRKARADIRKLSIPIEAKDILIKERMETRINNCGLVGMHVDAPGREINCFRIPHQDNFIVDDEE